MSDRPTPETDAAEFLANEIGSLVVESRLARRLEQERDCIEEMLSSTTSPLHQFVQECHEADGTEAGHLVAKVAVSYGRRFKSERDRLREINRELLEALEECLVAGVLSAPATLPARAAIAEAKGGEA